MRHLTDIEAEGYGFLAVGQTFATKGEVIHRVREAAESHTIQQHFPNNYAYTVVFMPNEMLFPTREQFSFTTKYIRIQRVESYPYIYYRV